VDLRQRERYREAKKNTSDLFEKTSVVELLETSTATVTSEPALSSF
jgi:hypothetical protein